MGGGLYSGWLGMSWVSRPIILRFSFSRSLLLSLLFSHSCSSSPFQYGCLSAERRERKQRHLVYQFLLLAFFSLSLSDTLSLALDDADIVVVVDVVSRNTKAIHLSVGVNASVTRRRLSVSSVARAIVCLILCQMSAH